MTIRSLAVASLALAVGAPSPSTAETKLIPGAFALPAAVGALTPPPEVSVDAPPPPAVPADSPPPASPDAASPTADAGTGAKAAPDQTVGGAPDLGIGAVEAARVAQPPQSAWRRMWSDILQQSPAASR